MILFSSFNQPYVFLLFCYLGFVCGLIYFFCAWIFSIIPKKFDAVNVQNVTSKKHNFKSIIAFILQAKKSKNHKKISQKNCKKNIVTKEKSSVQFIDKTNQKNGTKLEKKVENKEQKRLKKTKKKEENKIAKRKLRKEKKLIRKKNFQHFISKFRTTSKKIFIKFCYYLSKIAKFLVFFALIFACFYINLKINYGEISLIALLVFVVAFVLSRYFLNLLAKFFVNFYNNIKNKKGKNG